MTGDLVARPRRRPGRGAGGLALAALLGCGPAGAQWLSELQQAALALDPAVAGALATLRINEERVFQAKAGMGPSAGLTLSKGETRYHEPPESQNLREFRAKTATIQVTQPIARASLMFALDAAEAQFEQARFALASAESDATLRLLEACFEVLKARDVLLHLRSQLLTADEQLASARRSFAVGSVSVTDVREAEARIDTVAAQRAAAEAELELREQLLADRAGRPAPQLATLGLAPQRLPPLAASPVADWVADALRESPQVRQAEQALAAAEHELQKAWQGHAPTADLVWTWSRNSDTGTPTSLFPRRGDSSQVALNVTIPLFAGGATQSRVREAMAQRDKTASEVDAARRSVQATVRQAFAAAQVAAALARGLETANRSLEVALQANRRSYEVGLRVNADVLEAQSKLFEARRDLSRSRYDAWLNYLKLKAVAGRLAPGDIRELESMLVAVDTSPGAVRPPARRGATP